MAVVVVLLLYHDTLNLFLRELLILPVFLAWGPVSLACRTWSIGAICFLEEIGLPDLVLDLAEICVSSIMCFGPLLNPAALASLFLTWPWRLLYMLHWRLLKSLSTSFSLLAACILSWAWINGLLTGMEGVAFLTMLDVYSRDTVMFLLLVRDGNVFKVDLTWVVRFISTWWNHWVSLGCIHWNRLLAWHFLVWWTTLPLFLVNVA